MKKLHANYLLKAKKSVYNYLFQKIQHKHKKYFPEFYKASSHLLDSAEILAMVPELQHLDKKLNYFVLHASFGDKWFILSLIQEHLDLYQQSRLIASGEDRGLIEIFLGKELAEKKFIYVDNDVLNRLSSNFRPISRVSTQIIDSWSSPGCFHCITPFLHKNKLPSGTIRHLHVVYFPYFNELIFLHGVSYGVLLKTLLYISASSKPQQPKYYNSEDYIETKSILYPPGMHAELSAKPILLFNIINFSHESLTPEQINLVVSYCEMLGYRIIINIAQGNTNQNSLFLKSTSKNVFIVNIPPRVLALVSNGAHAVVGVLGGAMNIAAQFATAHVLSLQTPAKGTGVPEDELLGPWGKENMWNWWNQDWPCIRPGRVIENRFIGDPHSTSDKNLVGILSSFFEKIRAQDGII